MQRPTAEHSITKRATTKVLAVQPLPTRDVRAVVEELLMVAGWAPFHRACDDGHRSGRQLSGIEPWRFHALDAATCRALAPTLPPALAGKIPAMLNAADAMIMATWLPNPTPDVKPSEDAVADSYFAPTIANMEHIAAASAAIQNLLVAATARGIANYWSSGGVLRTQPVYQLLGIPTDQILLGAVFLFPADTGDAEVVGSKLREHRSPPTSWARWVELAATH